MSTSTFIQECNPRDGSTSSVRRSEIVMACFGNGPRAPRLLHRARNLAHVLSAQLLAVHMRHPSCAPGYLTMLEEHTRLAKELGAEVIVVPGQDVAETIISTAAAYQATHVVVGSPAPKRWYARWQDSFLRRLQRRLPDIDVSIIAHR
jgi:two-component system, OmpR family, sensor histidine kinase KdpD